MFKQIATLYRRLVGWVMPCSEIALCNQLAGNYSLLASKITAQAKIVLEVLIWAGLPSIPKGILLMPNTMFLPDKNSTFTDSLFWYDTNTAMIQRVAIRGDMEIFLNAKRYEIHGRMPYKLPIGGIWKKPNFTEKEIIDAMLVVYADCKFDLTGINNVYACFRKHISPRIAEQWRILEAAQDLLVELGGIDADKLPVLYKAYTKHRDAMRRIVTQWNYDDVDIGEELSSLLVPVDVKDKYPSSGSGRSGVPVLKTNDKQY